MSREVGVGPSALSLERIAPRSGLDARAWLTLLGSFVTMTVTFGLVNSYGVFQSYYTNHLLTNESSSTISWIGALQLGILYYASPIIGRIFDAHGIKVLLPAGSLVCVVSFILLSFCQRDAAWQFFIVHGVLYGVGNALVFTPCLAIVGHWFTRKRAFALGIVGAGTSVGGTVFPLMLQNLFQEVGFAWAARIVALLQLVCLTFACISMRTNLELSHRIAYNQIIDLSGFRDPRYCFAAISGFFFYYALFIPYFYIEDYALFRGMSASLSTYQVSILNAMCVPARIISGLLADRFGVLPVLIPFSAVSSVVTFSLWLLARDSAEVVAYSALYGLTSGPYFSLLSAYVATISPPEKFGARLGSVYPFVATACLAGPPTAGAFVTYFNEASFTHLIIFTGALLMAGSVMMGLAQAYQTMHPEDPGLISEKLEPRSQPTVAEP